MTPIRLLTEIGQGASLRREDPTAAAERAVRDALWRNSINLAELFGCEKEAMLITVEIGVPDPHRVDTASVAAAFPYGQVSVSARPGGLRVPRVDGAATLIATAAISVALEGVS